MQLYKNITTDNITYEKNNNNSMIFVKYNKNPFVIQGPKIEIPKLEKIQSNNDTKYYLDFDMNKSQKFYSVMDDIEKKIISDIEKNYKSWFNLDELEDENYKSFLNNNNFKAKINIKDDDILDAEIIQNKTVIKSCDLDTFEDILSESKYVKAIVQCTCLWTYNNKFGCSWKILSLKFID